MRLEFLLRSNISREKDEKRMKKSEVIKTREVEEKNTAV